MSAPSIKEVQAMLEDGPAAETRRAQRARLLDAVPTRRRTRTFALGVVLAITVIAVIAVPLLMRTPSETGPLGINEAGTAIAAGLSVNRPATWHLNDASEVVIAEGSSVSLQRIDRHAVDVELTGGRVDLSVTHGTGRMWHVHAGEFAVRIVGTKLHVERHGSRIEVGVTEGVVEVVGLGRTIQVHTGETWASAVVHPAVVEEAPIAPREPMPLAPTRVVAQPEREPKSMRPPSLPPQAIGWKTYFERGDYEHAFIAAKEQGALANAAQLSEDDVMALAAAARLSGQSLDAAALFQTAIDGHGSRRAEAAFLLGRLELQRGRTRAAAEAFEMSVTIDPTSTVGEEAWSRLLETVDNLNEPDRRRQVAIEYLRLFPQGAAAARAREVLSP